MRGYSRIDLAMPSFIVMLSVLAVASHPDPVAAAEIAADPDTTGTLTASPPDSLGHTMDVMVVTASRRDQVVSQAPAAVSVIDSTQITMPPVSSYGDLLRNVPGVNVAQTSALDLSISTRGATGILPQGQLALVDRRAVYQDYNNFVLWAAVPLELGQIDRIEVLRGPGSAMWGANAVDGVVHIISKDPRHSKGTSLLAGGGELNSAYGSVVHSGGSKRWGYTVAGGASTQDPYERPTGTVPGSEGPNNPGGTPYPDNEAAGLDTYRGNFRVDYHPSTATTWSASGGYADYRGTFLTPTGNYLFEEGTYSAFGKLDFRHDSIEATFYTTVERARGHFLQIPAPPTIDSEVYNLDVTDSRNVGDRHLLTYGVNARHADYRIGIAPSADHRDQAGAFLQDDIMLGGMFRFVIGARWDYIDSMGDAISPRASLIVHPFDRHQIRLSYNRAFLAPSILEQQFYLPLPPIVIPIDTPGGPVDLVFPVVSLGNEDLEQETVDAFEIAWTAELSTAARLGLSLYRNVTTDYIQQGTEFYSSSNPPPDWPLPPELLDVPPPDGFAGIPSAFVYDNFGKLVNQGIELSVDVRASRAVSFFANGSWQDEPELTDFPSLPLPNGTFRPAVNVPPKYRVNAGITWDDGRAFATGAVNYQDEAYWADMADPRQWGPTAAFTTFNAAVGMRFAKQRLVISIRGQNIFDARAQQHVWGDIIGRKITGQVEFRF